MQGRIYLSKAPVLRQSPFLEASFLKLQGRFVLALPQIA
jgi:hypothetical protein